MFSFNKNSISLKRHMLQRYRVDVGVGVGVHVYSSSSGSSSRSRSRSSISQRSISWCAVVLRRMQLGKRHVGRQGRSTFIALCLWAVDVALEMSFNL